jgi:hypothetical protein
MVQGICRIRYGGQGEKEMIVYDIEIAKAIRGRGEKKIPGIEYCGGWNDHANMGVACLCAYDYNEERYRVFMQDNITEFLELATYSDVVVGFNSYNFDNKIILAEYGIDLSSNTFDILREVWKSEGLDPDKFSPSTHGGYGLDDLAGANFHRNKTGHGAKAPIDFQQGRYGSVIDYCISDVKLTKMLMDRILDKGFLVSPKSLGKSIPIGVNLEVKDA